MRRNFRRECNSSTLFIMGVPLMHHRWVESREQAANADLVFRFLMHCASSMMTRYHLLVGPRHGRLLTTALGKGSLDPDCLCISSYFSFRFSSEARVPKVVRTTSYCFSSLKAVDRLSPCRTKTDNWCLPGRSNLSISRFHCCIRATGAIIRVDFRSALVAGRATISARAWIVFPSPISSAKMPPFDSLSSIFFIQANPSF